MRQPSYTQKDFQAKPSQVPTPTFGQILKEAYLHPFHWHARTTRKSYWTSFAINLVLLILITTTWIIFLYLKSQDQGNTVMMSVISIILAIILIWSYLAELGQEVRRLHDLDISGWFIWLNTKAPLMGVYLIYLYAQPTVEKPVQWQGYLWAAKDGDKYYQQKYQPDANTVPDSSWSELLAEYFGHIFDWNKRTSRRSYGMSLFVSYCLRILPTIFLIFELFGILFSFDDPFAGSFKDYWFAQPWNIVLVVLAVFVLVITGLANLGMTVRRFHDTGKHAYWCWLYLIPPYKFFTYAATYIVPLILGYFLMQPTLKEPGEFGPYILRQKNKKRS